MLLLTREQLHLNFIQVYHPCILGVPNKGGQNKKSKCTLGVTMMPLGAPSISKYGSPVRPDAQIVALRAHCVRTALKAPPYHNHRHPRYCFLLAQRLAGTWLACKVDEEWAQFDPC